MTFLAIRRMVRLVDLKDSGTQRHSERVAVKARKLALAAGWSERDAERLKKAGCVHDVGKIGIPQEILQKPARLTGDEFKLIKLHPEIGVEMLRSYGLFDSEQIDWVLHHHERADGNGYPDGLCRAELSDGAKLLALADSWDVMVSSRPYKKAMAVNDAVLEVQRMCGKQFCIEAVRALDKLVRIT